MYVCIYIYIYIYIQRALKRTRLALSHAHSHTHIYIYLCTCVSMYACVRRDGEGRTIAMDAVEYREGQAVDRRIRGPAQTGRGGGVLRSSKGERSTEKARKPEIRGDGAGQHPCPFAVRRAFSGPRAWVRSPRMRG